MRITLAFIVGILLASQLSVSVIGLLVLCVLLLSLAIIINQNYAYKFETHFGILTFGLFSILGMLFYKSYNKMPEFHTSGTFAAHVLETVEEKPNSYKSLLKIDAVLKNDSIFSTNEAIVVYFEKTKTAQQLQPGNTIIFSKTPERIKNNGNPYEFNYQKYLARKRIYRRIYLAGQDWKVSPARKTSIRTLAETYRNKLLHIYRQQALGDQETEILSALTLGYKRGLDPETKRVFSSAGAMHVLAVSGLHVGILFGVFTLLFGFLRKLKHGKPLFVLLALSVLWGYAFITGLSPSVMRAATMFSLVCIAGNINRRPNIYNTLSFSAFILLIINPNNLFEVGFQLSYTAVFGIVFLQPKFESLITVKHKIPHFFWTLLTVSVAAQIATFPITAYYFGQFPTYFWLSNLIVIPAVFVLISLGILLLLVSGIPLLGPTVATLTQWALKIVYLFLKGIESLPGAVGEISVSPGELVFLTLAFVTAFVFIEFKQIRALKAMLLSFVIMASVHLVQKYHQLSYSEVIVYNNASNLVVHLIKGQSNYIISEKEIADTDYVLRQIEIVRKKKRLRPPKFIVSKQNFVDEFLFCKNNIIYFDGELIEFKTSEQKPPGSIRPQLLITNKYVSDSIVSGYQTVITNHAHQRYSGFNNTHVLQKKGAYQLKWRHRSASSPTVYDATNQLVTNTKVAKY